MRSFHGPHAFLKPVEQRQIVSGATEYCLTKVNVRLHKAGEDDTTCGINDDVSRLVCLAYGRNTTVANTQIAANDRVIVVHRQQRTVLDENRIHIVDIRLESGLVRPARRGTSALSKRCARNSYRPDDK
jgi:hypothetical protein